MDKKKILAGILCSVACEILFGFSFLFTKKITATVPAMTLLSWRFDIAFLLMSICILARIIKVNYKGKKFLPLVIVAVLQPVIYFIGETIGINLTTAAESGTIIACIPVITLLFSAVILKELPKRLQISGVSITVIGIIMVVLLKGFEAKFNVLGYIMLLVAVVSAGLFSVFSQKADMFTSTEKTYVMTAFGAATFTTIALIQNGANGTLREFFLLPLTNSDFLTAVLYLGAGCSVAAFLLLNTAIAYIGTNKSTSFVGISTLVTVIAGIIILKESFTVYQGIGAVLVLGGVYIANIIPNGNKQKYHDS